MFTLSKTRIMKRSLLVLAFSIAVVAGAFIAVKNIQIGVVEAAEEQAGVKSDGAIISYDDSGATYRYSVLVDGEDYKALCAEPRKTRPAGDDWVSYNYSPLDNDKIKLLVYLATNPNKNNNAFVDNLYGTLIDGNDKENQRFAYIHATIGVINGDFSGLSQNSQNIIEAIIDGGLNDAIINNSDIWLIAKNYTLYTTNPSDPDYQSVVWIKFTPQYGNIKVQKCDKEIGADGTGVCKPQAGASFSGIEFEIYNASDNKIYIPNKDNPGEGTFYESGALITTETADSSGKVTFRNLPLNIRYLIKESAGTNRSYAFATTGNTTEATITSNDQTVSKTFENNVVRGDLKFTKTSNVDGEPMANVVFKIKSTSGAKEEHLVVTDEDGIVDTSASHALHSFHTNGYDDIEEDEIEYLAYGTWFGAANAVDDDKGALPYDTYEITELECDANKFCYDIGDTKKTVTIKTNGEVVDLGEWSNDCAEFSIATTATDNTDGDKIVAFNEDVEIKDVVDYCLKKDMEFTIKGVVMNKNTKEPVMVDGKRVEQTITLTPESACGTIEMIYSLNTKDLGGTDLVIFEELYYGDELILSHSDFNNASQTVSVAPPPPDTGAITKTANGGILSDNATIIVFAIGGSLGLYASARAFSRKRFLNKKY